MKKILKLFPFFLSLLLLFTACSSKDKPQSTKLKVIASLFPQYDFAKQIAKDKAEVSLLLPPGSESHTFDPSTNDILKISSSDIFLYTGKYMEPWAERLLSGIDSSSLFIKDVSSNVNLLKDSHSEHEGEDHADSSEHHHEHEYDPHFWLDPTLACVMVDNILECFCTKDPDNAEFYKNNAEKIKNDLLKLDENISQTVKNAKRDTIVFAGKFAHLYFINRYNLKYEALIKNCSEQSEPSVQKITKVINFIKENNIPAVYYEELTMPATAQSLCNNTNAIALRFNTIHNISKEQLENNVSYMDLMNENLENLKQGLN